MLAGLTEHPVTGQAYFGSMDTFVSYTWRGEGITLKNLVEAVEDTLKSDPTVEDHDKVGGARGSQRGADDACAVCRML